MGSPIHLVVRYSDSLVGEIDTIAMHRAVIDEKGSVWLAKLGKPVGQDRIDKLNAQATTKSQSFLYLVQNMTKRYVWARGTISRAQREMPKENELIPGYYEQFRIIRDASTWFKLTEIIHPPDAEVSGLVVASSARPIHYALHESMAPMFYVRRQS